MMHPLNTLREHWGSFRQLRRTVAFRLTLPLLVSVFVIVFILAAFSYRYSLNTLEAGAARDNLQTIVQANRQIDQILMQYEDMIRAMTNNRDFLNKLNVYSYSNYAEDVELASRTLLAHMEDLLRSSPRSIQSATIFSWDQSRVVSTLRRDASLPLLRDHNSEEIRALPWFQQLLDRDDDFFFLNTQKQAFLSTDHGEPMLAAVFHIHHSLRPEQLVGTVFVELHISRLKDALQGFKLGEGGQYAIVDRDGMIIYADDETLIGTRFTGALPAFRDDSSANHGNFYAEDDNGVVHNYSYQQSLLSDWTLIGYYPKEELLAPIRKMIYAFIWISLISSAVAAIVVGLIIQHRVGMPLSKLRLLMQEGEKGNLTVRTDDNGNSEIGDLGRAFNRMMDQIMLAYYDTLTDLPNRRMLVEHLRKTLERMSSENSRLAVLFVDLDRFKMVNDSLGHHAGDLLIKAVGQRLQQKIDQQDMVARIAGDEFVIVLPVARREMAEEIAEELLQELRKPYPIMEQELHVTASIGIAYYPDDARDAETLIKYADMAMYEAKSKGKNTVKLYHSALTVRSQERLRIENDLHRAIDQQEFELYYQPRMEAQSGRILGCEALIRWHHPVYGMIPPDKFIPVAEETDLIVAIDEWVIKEAIRQNQVWHQAGYPPMRIAVNVSAKQFESGLVGCVRRQLEEMGLDGQWLEIEITERVLLDNEATIKHTINALQEMGIQLAIDDFGTGYSSLAFLMKFQVNTLKIDKTFIRDIHTNPDHQSIVAAIIQLAHNLGISVVSEGVESEEEVEFLTGCGSDEMQGYYFGRPMPAGSYEEQFLQTMKDDASEGSR